MKRVIEFIDKLILDSSSLIELSRDYFSSPKRSTEYYTKRERWLNNCNKILNYVTLKEYANDMNSIIKSEGLSSTGLARIVGLLQSAKDIMEAGFVNNVRFLLHAELYDSLLDQSRALLETGHKIPAAVLGRIVVERWIRDLAEKNGIENFNAEKVSILNDLLKKAGIYHVPKWRIIQSHLDVGNSAAHGKDSQFTEDDVKRLLDFGSANCI